MRIYSDATISDFLRSISENQRQRFLDKWNEERNKRERIYVSYDSTNKNCEAGNISMVEYGAEKVDTGLPMLVSVRVGASERLREGGCGTNTAKTGHVTGVGVFTILEVRESKGSDGLKSGAGWISLDMVEII